MALPSGDAPSVWESLLPSFPPFQLSAAPSATHLSHGAVLGAPSLSSLLLTWGHLLALQTSCPGAPAISWAPLPGCPAGPANSPSLKANSLPSPLTLQTCASQPPRGHRQPPLFPSLDGHPLPPSHQRQVLRPQPGSRGSGFTLSSPPALPRPGSSPFPALPASGWRSWNPFSTRVAMTERFVVD